MFDKYYKDLEPNEKEELEKRVWRLVEILIESGNKIWSTLLNALIILNAGGVTAIITYQNINKVVGISVIKY